MAEATLKVGVDARDGIRELDKVENKLEDVDGQATKTNDKFKKFGTAVKVGMLAGVAAAGALAAAVNGVINKLDKIGKTADKIGLSTSSLQELRFAAEQSGVATTALDMGMQRFSRRVAEAAQGSGVLKEEFKALGISAKDSEGNMKSLDSILNEYADAIKNAGSEQEQLRLAFKAFDSEGAAMVNMLRNGAAGLDDFRKEANDLGLIMDEKLVRSAEMASDELNRVTSAIKAKFTVALAELIPVLVAVSKALLTFVNWVIKAGKAIHDFFVTTNTERIAEIDQQLRRLTEVGTPHAINQIKLLARERASLTKMIEQETMKEAALDELRLNSVDTTVKLTDANKNLKKEIDPVAEIMKKYGYSLEDISNEQLILNDLLEKGVISWDEYAEAQLGVEDASQKVVKAAKDACGEMKDNTEKCVSEQEKIWDNYIENVQRAFGDLIYDGFQSIFRDGENAWQSFLDTMMDMFLRWMADLVAAWVSKNIFGNLLGGTSLAGGGIGAALSGLGSSIGGGISSAVGGIGSLLGIGGGATAYALPAGYMTPAVGTPLGASAGITSGGGQAPISASASSMGNIAGTAFAAGFVAISAKILLDSFGDTGDERRQDMIKAEFDAYAEQGMLAGENIRQLSEGMRSFGEAGQSMWIGVAEGADEFKAKTVGGKLEMQRLRTVLKSVGADFDQFYNANGEHMFRFTGDIDQAKLAIEAMGTEVFDTMVKNADAIQKVDQTMMDLGLAIKGTTHTVNELTTAIESIPDREVIINTRFTESGSLGEAYSSSVTDFGSGYSTPTVDFGSGYAHGGSFIVGGSGGTDSTPVGFMATPGEKVTVETPEQQQSQPIIINIESDGKGLDQFIRVVADDHRVQVNRSQVRATERIY